MDRDMNILYILGVPLGYVMEWIYNLIPNYGWDIIIFTIGGTKGIEILEKLTSEIREYWPDFEGFITVYYE